MITRFKIFENLDKECYWKIPLDPPKLRIALKKIGMNSEEIDEWCNMLSSDFEGQEYIFIFSHEDAGWMYSRCSSKREHKEKFMGVVDIEDWEVDAEKYNV